MWGQATAGSTTPALEAHVCWSGRSLIRRSPVSAGDLLLWLWRRLFEAMNGTPLLQPAAKSSCSYAWWSFAWCVAKSVHTYQRRCDLFVPKQPASPADQRNLQITTRLPSVDVHARVSGCGVIVTQLVTQSDDHPLRMTTTRADHLRANDPQGVLVRALIVVHN